MQSHRADALDAFYLRPLYYRRLYRTVLRVVVWNSFLLAALCVLTAYLGFYGFKPEAYFTTSPSGRIIELKAKPQTPYLGVTSESPPAPQNNATTQPAR